MRYTELSAGAQQRGWKTKFRPFRKMSFQVFPSELVFQNFTPFQTYTLPLILLNKGTVPQSVMLEKLNSKVFHVVGPENGSGKVASGLAATFTVSFTPQENKQTSTHTHTRACARVCVCTDSKRLNPSIYSCFKLLSLVSVSTTTVCSSPFSVTPSCGTLDVGESMQVTVFFQPMTVGSHQEDLVLHYHTGEQNSAQYNETSDIVELKKTYIGLANTHTACLVNKNHFPLRFRWTVWPSQQDEDLGSFRFELQMSGMQNNRLSLFQIRFLHFLLFLMKQSISQFHIVFKPKEARLYQHTIYCDITGHESRLPLIISGEGLGPKLQLNYNLMDIKNVFIGDKNRYEISNKGLIDAPFRFSSSDTTFGHYFSIRPTEGVVPPEAHQIVEVTFKSHTLGPFSEDLLLTVTGQPQPLTLTFRGCVICPTFNFDVWDLEFGDVAFGFPSTLTCTLFNTSFVPINFVLRVLGDGLGSPSVSGFRQVSDLSLKSWQGHTAQGVHERPVEFTVSPAAGSVSAMSDITIKVTLCSNTVKTYWVAMVVDVEGVGEHIRTLPINFCIIVCF
uniref:HYDIN/VesB/CFA65-like Ig-like domain-containing protein n=1 Tax=Nothobranchius furzeri TaxID=105023 RepID=A0A8C6LRJ5_NOTFU